MVDPSADIHSLLDLLSMSLGFLAWVSFYAFFYVFPDGRFVPRWTRWPLIALALYQACLLFAPDGSPLDPAEWPPLLPLVLVPCLFGTMAFAQLYRYLRVSGTVERQQTKWVVFGLTAALTGAIAPVLLTIPFPMLLQAGVPKVLYVLTDASVSTFALLLIPLSIGIAILHHRLWDIDLIIKRSLVYGSLSAVLAAVFAITDTLLLPLLVKSLLGEDDPTLNAVISAVVIAVLFEPLRRSIKAGVNKLSDWVAGGVRTSESYRSTE